MDDSSIHSTGFQSFSLDGTEASSERNIDEEVEEIIKEAIDEETASLRPAAQASGQQAGESTRSNNRFRSRYVLRTSIPQLALQLEISMICEHCERQGTATSLCICPGCRGDAYHTACWPLARTHQPNRGKGVRKECAQTDFSEYVWTQHLFRSETTSEVQAQLHMKDIWTTWFGVPHLQDHPNLYIYNRLDYLVKAAQASRDDMTSLEQYPSLVSFFGETGQGKSTLIRALIRNAAPDTNHQVPVPGNDAEKNISTSGDVHLYSDPRTINTEVPLFYADCEGLRGSGVPTATSVSQGIYKFTTKAGETLLNALGGNPGDGANPTFGKRALRQNTEEHRGTASRVLPLQWANVETRFKKGGLQGRESMMDSESQDSVVGDLYPRLLYAFSDVVCYITTNPKATQHELTQLFEWACTGHERTLNQPIRPGLVIVINKDPTTADERWLDVDFATQKLLEPLILSAAFLELREKWRMRGRVLDTAEDLILCYYDSFRVIFIPELRPETTHKVAAQYQKLYAEIRNSSKRLRLRKINVNMNINVSSFSVYLETAFTRLATDLTSLIDFHYLESKDAKRPTEFSEHITALLVTLKSHEESGNSGHMVKEYTLIERLIPFIACCIARMIFQYEPQTGTQELIEDYIRNCRRAFERFRDKSWRCEAVNDGGLRCLNHWGRHDKGHQFIRPGQPKPLGIRYILRRELTQLSQIEGFPTLISPQDEPSGESLVVGNFQCAFDPEKLLTTLHSEINRLLASGVTLGTTSLVAQASGVSSVRSNWTCFTCLTECPVYILPCENRQHAICRNCARSFSTDKNIGISTVRLNNCPLGCQFMHGKPWKVRIKPQEAGVRLLSLDGGGIRGILELCILQKIVNEVGFGIPIQELFDLTIGTSTGGIIALGLFKMDWTIENAIAQFIRLGDGAFAKRYLLKLPVFKSATQLLYSHRYKSEGIDSALQKAFGQGKLFGYNTSSNLDRVMVGVVASVQGSTQPYLFTNYSRNSTGNDDRLVREENLNDELKTWEAARCTSAAQTYFEPYFHANKSRSYVDGAMMRNNPVQLLEDERRLIWSNKERPIEQHGSTRSDGTTLDIMVSIGTGIHTDKEGAIKSAHFGLRVANRLTPKGLRGKLAVGYDMVQNTLDCNKIWNDFVASHQECKRDCHRLNIGLSEPPPKIDDTKSIQSLRSTAEWYLRPAAGSYVGHDHKSAHEHILAVARRLTAALFYFERETTPDQETHIGGTLRCRLSSAMKIQFKNLLNEKPSFRVRQLIPHHGWEETKLKVKFDTNTFSSDRIQVDTRVLDGYVIQMYLPKWPGWECISGFREPTY